MPSSLGRCPQALCSPAREREFGPSEVQYYARDYVGLDWAPIPTCYDVAYAAERRRYHILMDDLSATHRNNRKATPTLAYGQAVADALAALHAYRWGDGRLREIEAAVPGVGEIDRYVAHIAPGLAPMLDSSIEDIAPSWRSVLPRVFERHPTAMRARTARHEGFTLVHGDVNPGNVLSPRQGDGPTYLINRQPFDWSLTTWLGVGDVAYLMVQWWDTALRRCLALPVLHHYYDGLVRRGVVGYAWEQLVEDYRLCAVQSLYLAAARCADERARAAMRWVWLPQLKKALAALTDLGCADLWG